MSSDDLSQLEALFHEALSLAPEQRSALFQRVGAEDRELARQLEELLAEAHAHPLGFEHVHVRIRRPMNEPSSGWIGANVGSFRIESLLAEGGMSQVFVAEQKRPRRKVALKLVHLRAGHAHSLARFEREAEILAALDHPGIAKLFEVSTHETALGPQPYLAMELVDGETITSFARARGLDVSARAALFGQVCDAVQHAHQKGVIHRDLKPANVLVDRGGNVKVLDFGIARVFGGALHGAPTLTLDGQLLGTLAYMSPEHLGGGANAVDVRSDVYALGVMLFELLTERLPHDVDGVPYAEVARRIAHDAPLRMSSVRRELRGDLDVIVGVALEKEPARRYASAADLGADLHRWLAREPIAARPPSLARRAHLWTLRHPTSAAAGAVTIVSVVALAYLAYALSGRDRELRDREARFAPFKSMDDVRRLAARADELWPVHPRLAHEYASWLEDGRAVGSELRRQSSVIAEMLGVSAASNESIPGLSAALATLTDRDSGLIDGVSPEHGWGVARRQVLLRSVEEQSLTGANARAAWDAAIRSIADERECPAYHGLHLAPQFGLLPIAKSTETGLWEFAHLLTGEVPSCDEGSAVHKLADEDGLVFVLLPGGAFSMGAQFTDPGAPNYCETAELNETPVNTVTLAPFFVSKFEMNQAQWVRCTGSNPSAYHGVQADSPASDEPLLHPVERVNWFDSLRVTKWLGLCVPAEAQWEYAARGGTTTPWSTGAERASLMGAANIADRTAGSGGFDWPEIADWPEFDDGAPEHARVDAMRPNPFGLVHVHGNVLEWCLEGWSERLAYVTPADEHGLREVLQAESPYARVVRGGAFDRSANRCRSAYRANAPADMAGANIGLRPVRTIDQ